MVDKLKEMAGMAFWFLIFVAIISLPLVFFMGAAWASKNLLGFLYSYRVDIACCEYCDFFAAINIYTS